MLLGTLEPSLLGNLLSGKGIERAGYGSKRVERFVRAGYGSSIKKGPNSTTSSYKF